MGHIVLPNSGGRAGSPGKFVDTAVVDMIERLKAEGSNPRSVYAKLTGGANMFASNGPFQIGQQNIAAVRETLTASGIRRVAEHVGGHSGRRVTFDAANGSLTIEVAGAATVTI
jgi:chemotaxis protein CheD